MDQPGGHQSDRLRVCSAAPGLPGGPAGRDERQRLTANVYSEQLTYTPTNHTLKFGVGGSQNNGTSVVATNQIGTFYLGSNLPFDPS